MRKVVFSFLFICLFPVEIYATEKRIALVIGNGNYPEVGVLPNPVNDADLMARTLSGLGFSVDKHTDVSHKQMKIAIRDFGRALDEGGEDAVGLFFFAGHGLQLDGVNYIIPVDAVIDRRGDVDIEAVDMGSVLSMMEYSRSRLNFVILDACRNNPYARGFRSMTRGLAQMDSPTGTLIAYSTSPGSLAADGEGRNSPYSSALASAMQKQGVEVERMFRIVRNDVRSLTNNAQTPWESSSLTGDSFYFNTTAAPAAKTDSVPPENENSKLSSTVELEFWKSVEDSSDPNEIQSYIDNYPNGHFVILANIRLKKLQSQKEGTTGGSDEAATDRSTPEKQDSIDPVPSILTDSSAFDGTWDVKVSAVTGCLDNEPRSFTVMVNDGVIDEQDHLVPKNGTVSQGGHFVITARDASGRLRSTQTGTIVGGVGVGQFLGRRAGCTGKVELRHLE